MREKIKKLQSNGFFHIVGAGTLNKIISLCSGIVIVRLLSQTSYGIYTYVLNIIDIILIFDGLGTQTGLMQYGCEYRKDTETRNTIVRCGLRLGVASGIILSIAACIYGLFGNQSIENTGYLFILAMLIPVMTYTNHAVGTLLRIEEKNKEYGFYSVLSSAVVMGSIVVGALVADVAGAIAARYVGFVFLLVFAFFKYPTVKEILFGKTKEIAKSIKNNFLKFSLTSCANNSIAHLFYTVDIFLIGLLIVDPDVVAAYKVATTIPFALSFITNSIVVYIYPKYVAHKNDAGWLSSHYKKLVLYLALLNGVIAAVGFIFAPLIIRIVHGAVYVSQSTSAFRILILGFFASSVLRIPAGNVLDMLHKVKANLVISIICGCANVVLDYVLIVRMNAIGAVIATSSIYLLYGLLSNFCVIGHIKKLRKNSVNESDK